MAKSATRKVEGHYKHPEIVTSKIADGCLVYYAAAVKGRGGVTTTSPDPIRYNSATRTFSFSAGLKEVGTYEI